MRLLLLPCLLLLPAGSALAGAQHFGARLDQAQWQVSSSRLHCTLSHEVPYYGTARFEGRAGGDLAFVLEVLQQPDRAGTAQLVAVAPAWMHDAAATDLGQVPIADSRAAFRFPRPLARRVLAELEKGMNPTLTYSDWADGRDQVTVALSAVNVRSALGQFLQCLTGLLPYDFNDVKQTEILFAFGSHALSAEAKAQLDKVVRYLLADDSVGSVRLVGYTDNVGFRRYNERLSRQRSEAVRDYLAANGVKSPKMVIEAHGETKPQGTNRTEQGRQENRRVLVILVK